MERQAAIERLLDHYQHPRNHGPLAGADRVYAGGVAGCGDQVTIYLKVAPGDTIERVTFEGHGCTVSQAAASILTELVPGRTLAEVRAIDEGELIDLLGREVVATRQRCATTALSTLKAAVAAYQRDGGMR